MAGTTVVAVLGLSLVPALAQNDETSDDMGGTETMEEMEPGLYVADAWTRESPMLELAGAAYMTIHNSTDTDDALVGATSPAAEFVELHLSAMDDEGMMSMNQVGEIPVPAHAEAVLKPGSYHLMLIELVDPLTEGAEVELNLEFAVAEPQTVTAPVLAEPPMTSEMDGMDTDEGGSMDMDDADDMDGSMEEDEG
jgi:copper(I)-binding protein